MMLICDWSNGPPEPFLRPIATSESSLFVDTIYKLKTIVELKLSMEAKENGPQATSIAVQDSLANAI